MQLDVMGHSSRSNASRTPLRRWVCCNSSPSLAAVAGRTSGLCAIAYLDGYGAGLEPHTLPVPLPAEWRNVGAAVEHLAGRLHCVVLEFGRVVFDGSSELAGLEVGSLPDHS